MREIAIPRGPCCSYYEQIALARMVLDRGGKLAATTADRDNLREFVGPLVDVHVWDQGRFAETNAEAVFAEAVRRDILVLDPHPQPCTIEECECGDYDGRMWRLAWVPATGTQQKGVQDGG